MCARVCAVTISRCQVLVCCLARVYVAISPPVPCVYLNTLPISCQLQRNSFVHFHCQEREMERGRERAQRRSPTTVIHKITLMKVKCGSRQQSVRKKRNTKLKAATASASVANSAKVLRTTKTRQLYSALLLFSLYFFIWFVDLLTTALVSADALMQRHHRSRSMFPFASYVLSILLKLDTDTNCANVLVIIINAASALCNFDIQFCMRQLPSRVALAVKSLMSMEFFVCVRAWAAFHS